MTELRSGHGSKAKARADRVVIGSGGVALDDLDKANESEFCKEVLFAAIDGRMTNEAPLLVTTNLDLEETCERLGDPIASRLAGYCEVVEMNGPDRRLA